MRIESVPSLVKSIDLEVSLLRKKESSYEYRKAAEYRELDSSKEIQNDVKIIVEEVKGGERVTSPFISSTLIANIEDALFSNSIPSSSFPSSQSTTSSNSPHTSPSSSGSTTVDSSTEKKESVELEADVAADNTPYLANMSPEMTELLIKRSHLHNEWQGIRTKLANINKMRHAIEALKTSLKSATKLGNHSKIDSIEQFEIPEKESIMTSILSSISPESPFYYLCDTVTSTEIANIMAKNTGIPMGNLLEGFFLLVFFFPYFFVSSFSLNCYPHVIDVCYYMSFLYCTC